MMKIKLTNMLTALPSWILDPQFLVEKFGKIDFQTIKFFKPDGKPYTPEGGGPTKHIYAPFTSSREATILDVHEDDFLPDQWLIDIPEVVVEFEFFNPADTAPKPHSLPSVSSTD